MTWMTAQPAAAADCPAGRLPSGYPLGTIKTRKEIHDDPDTPLFIPKSTYTRHAVFDRCRCHRGDGDMWPITWADDGHLHGAAGDNSVSPMNFQRVKNGSCCVVRRYRLECYGKPRPYHQGPSPESCLGSQLTLFEAPEPQGAWSLFQEDDDWGTYGDYQPNFLTKWMPPDGLTTLMVFFGSFDDYNTMIQKVTLELWQYRLWPYL